jgi:hypothetical protein
MEQRDLKDYIVKLNDRNIQRQRETGFTLYAILGSIVFCVFYLIDNIEIPISIFNDNKFLNVAVFVSNAMFIFSFLYISYGTATRRQTLTKIFPYKQPIKIEISDYPFFLSYLTICTLNLMLIGQHQNLPHKIFLIIFSALTALNILSPFVIKLYGNIKQNKKKKKGLSIEEFDFTFFNKKAIRIFSVAILIYATILSIYWGIVALCVDFNMEPKTIASVSKYVIIYFALLYLTKKTMDIKSKEHENNQLEDFEKEIFFENISNEQISKKFEKDFDGIPFSKWITEKQIEIMNFFDQKRQAFLAQDLLIINVDGIDKVKLPYEFSGRLQDVINSQSSILSETTDFVQRISTAFNDLKNFSSLNEEEVDQLNYVQNYLNQLIMAFNRQYSNLSQQIEARQNT